MWKMVKCCLCRLVVCLLCGLGCVWLLNGMLLMLCRCLVICVCIFCLC